MGLKMEVLESRLTFLQLLYGCKLLIRGEQRPGGIDRLIDYIKTIHGSSAIDALASKSFSDLREALATEFFRDIEIRYCEW